MVQSEIRAITPIDIRMKAIEFEERLLVLGSIPPVQITRLLSRFKRVALEDANPAEVIQIYERRVQEFERLPH